MKIVLLRHGKPDLAHGTSLHTREIPGFIQAYDAAGITLDQPPTEEAIEQAGACKLVVCSNLFRSTESARALGANDKLVTDADFREVGMPYPLWPPLRLPLNLWATVLRLIQLAGYQRNGESISGARLRVRAASKKLVASATEHGSVLLVGHGYMNRFLARELLKRGWVGPKTPGHEFWQCSTYRLPGDSA